MDVDDTGPAGQLPDEQERQHLEQPSDRPGSFGAPRGVAFSEPLPGPLPEPPPEVIDEVSPDGIDEIEARLDRVERALTWLDDGTYGQCRTCGSPIEDELIEVDPTSVSCSACAESASTRASGTD